MIKNSKFLAVAMAASLVSMTGAANAAVLLDFEGSSNSDAPGSTDIVIGDFYNGGFDSGETAGTNFGISFSNANFDSTSQFTQPGFNITSSIAYMAASPLTFTSAKAFKSIAFDRYFFTGVTTVNVFSGANGEGDLLATATYGQNCFPACTFARESLSFDNALSVAIIPNANGTGIDNLAVGLVPEPATWAMMVIGFGVVGAGIRRRKALTSRVSYAVA